MLSSEDDSKGNIQTWSLTDSVCVVYSVRKPCLWFKDSSALCLHNCVGFFSFFFFSTFCFLLLTLSYKHALINQRPCTPAEGREVHQIGSQLGVKNSVLKLLTHWDINKSKVFVCKPWRLILYNSMSCLCFYDWCF